MVFFFTSNVTDPPTLIYMGRDKFENEDLIKYGYEEDIWFHVDKFSSAHLYVRMNKGTTIDTLSPALIQDCAQLVKANSIEGNKKNNVTIVYTPWSNLKKTQGMEIGEVGFIKQNLVKRTHVEKRINEIVNRLNKTKEEKNINFQEEKMNRLRKERVDMKNAEAKKKQLDEQEQEEKRSQAAIQSYAGFFDEDKMKTNKDFSSFNIQQYEDSFM